MFMRNKSAAQFLAVVCLVALLGAVGFADDWPTWRGNASRTASTAEQLPVDLHLQWTRQLSPLKPAWPEDPRVGDGGKVYFTSKGVAQAYDLKNQENVTTKDRRGQPVEIQVPKLLWRLDGQPVTRVHAKAGNRLYAHHEHTVLAIDVPGNEGDKPAVSWKAMVEGTPATMLVADGKLFVVTHEGGIHCFAS